MKLKIKQQNLSQEAYIKIKKLILDDVLKSGEKVIQEKMAKKLGISRIPIIQALSLLKKEHLLEYYAGKGYYVRKIPKKEYFDLIDIRIALECLAVESIIKNMNSKLKNCFLKFLNDFEKYSEKNDFKNYYELDKKFHYFLIEASNNYYLKHIDATFNVLLLTFLKGFSSEINISMEHHRKIIKAIVNEDVDSAIKLLREHTDNKKKTYTLNYKEEILNQG